MCFVSAPLNLHVTEPVFGFVVMQGLDPEETMAVIISKTFTTAETMLNARTVRTWLTAQLGEWAMQQLRV